MLEKVKRIASNPLHAAQIEEEEALAEEEIKKKNEKKINKDLQLETAILEKTLIKIGGAPGAWFRGGWCVDYS